MISINKLVHFYLFNSSDHSFCRLLSTQTLIDPNMTYSRILSNKINKFIWFESKFKNSISSQKLISNFKFELKINSLKHFS
jgi:hypothetical protein